MPYTILYVYPNFCVILKITSFNEMNVANNPIFIDQNYSIYEKQYAIHKRRFIFFKKGCVNTNVLNSVNTNNSVTFHLSILPTWGNWCQSSWLINTRFIGQRRQTNLFEKNASSQEMLSWSKVCALKLGKIVQNHEKLVN